MARVKYKYKTGQGITAIRLLAAISACFNGAEVKTEGIIIQRYIAKNGEKDYILLAQNGYAEGAFEREIDRGMQRLEEGKNG